MGSTLNALRPPAAAPACIVVFLYGNCGLICSDDSIIHTAKLDIRHAISTI